MVVVDVEVLDLGRMVVGMDGRGNTEFCNQFDKKH